MPPVTSRPTTSETADARQAQVLHLAKEIEQLAETQLPREQFFQKFLTNILLATSAPVGAVWLMQEGRLHLCSEIRLTTTGLQENADLRKFHQRLLGEVMANGQARLVHTDEEPSLAFPLRSLMILTALQANGACCGVVQIFQRPDIAPASRGGYLQYIEQMTHFASRYLERTAVAKAPATTGTINDELARYGVQLQRSLLVRDVAAVAANDGRLLVGCDRVSVVTQRGRKVQVQAVSGQESIHSRANLVTAMVRLSREAIQSGVPISYTGSTDDFPPQVKERLADFVQESGARMVLVVPLRAPTPLVPQKPKDDRPPALGDVFGCLVIEQFNSSEPSRELTERLDWFKSYTAAALHNARTYQSIFLLPLWRTLGHAATWLSGRRLLKTLAAVALVTAIVCVLTLVRIDFRVEGDGRLMPVVRREIFVPYDGEVIEVLVASGEHVAAGQSLVKLRNNELRSELVATESQCEEKRKLQMALKADRDEAHRGPSGERAHRIEGELAKTTAELNGLERKLKVLKDRDELLDVRSPIAGVVSTFEVDQLLRDRPVRRGEILLEVMDDTGPWHLELNVAEHRAGHLLRAQATTSEPLPVEYLLVTSPEVTHQAAMKEVGTRVVTSDDNRLVIEVLASPSEDDAVSRRIGAEVRARLHCGQASLGYVLFGDVIEFIQKYLWL